MLRLNGTPFKCDVARRKGIDVEPGDDSKIGTSSFERSPQIIVARRIGIDDFSACQSYLIVDNTIAGESSSRRSPSDAATERKPNNAYR